MPPVVPGAEVEPELKLKSWVQRRICKIEKLSAEHHAQSAKNKEWALLSSKKLDCRKNVASKQLVIKYPF